MIKNILRLDWLLLTATLLLVGLSLATLFPISYTGSSFNPGEGNNFIRQAIFSILGIVIFFIFSFFDYRVLRGLSPILFLTGVFLLLVVLIFGK
ncbi:MAG: FtsW/RodA/SpoVE family cell cycle protein, partial [Candidatus Moranbacteria bacterium]|nr:FtsW/RodA/SpoVE family cell cycle protein [Candidatus Moranbacteria bacterium]